MYQKRAFYLNSDCANGYYKGDALIAHHVSTTISKYPQHEHIDRFWYCINNNGNCKDLFEWIGINCTDGVEKYDPKLHANSIQQSIIEGDKKQNNAVNNYKKEFDAFNNTHYSKAEVDKKFITKEQSEADKQELLKGFKKIMDAKEKAYNESLDNMKKYVDKGDSASFNYAGKLRNEVLITVYADISKISARVDCLKVFVVGLFNKKADFIDSIVKPRVQEVAGAICGAGAGAAVGATTVLAPAAPAAAAGAAAVCHWKAGDLFDSARKAIENGAGPDIC